MFTAPSLPEAQPQILIIHQLLSVVYFGTFTKLPSHQLTLVSAEKKKS